MALRQLRRGPRDLGALAQLVQAGAFGEDADGICTESLDALRSDLLWSEVTKGRSIIVGVAAGEDRRDFLRTATRANAFLDVRRL